MHPISSTCFAEDSVNSFNTKNNSCTSINWVNFFLILWQLREITEPCKGLSSKSLWKCYFNRWIKFTTCLLTPSKRSRVPCHFPPTLLLTSKTWYYEMQSEWPFTRNIKRATAPNKGFKGVERVATFPCSKSTSNSQSSEERAQGGRGQGVNSPCVHHLETSTSFAVQTPDVRTKSFSNSVAVLQETIWKIGGEKSFLHLPWEKKIKDLTNMIVQAKKRLTPKPGKSF